MEKASTLKMHCRRHSNQTWRIKSGPYYWASNYLLAENGKTRHGKPYYFSTTFGSVRRPCRHTYPWLTGERGFHPGWLRELDGFMQNSARFLIILPKANEEYYQTGNKQVITGLIRINGVPYNQDPTIMKLGARYELDPAAIDGTNKR